MNIQQTAIQELNDCLGQMTKAWMIIINVDGEIYFTYEDYDDPDPRTSKITGYGAELEYFSGLGCCWLNDDGKIAIEHDRELGSSATLSTYVSVEFPRPIMKVIEEHVSPEFFDTQLDHLNLNCKVNVSDVDRCSVMVLLGGVISDLRLAALDETLVRSNAQKLLRDLQLFLPWFDYAAALADQIVDESRRVNLIEDIRLVVEYIDRGGVLNFAKLTSLCDVAGSLQPVRNLIKNNRPELAV